MSIDLDDPRLTAYALGELDDAADVTAVETLLNAHPEARRVVDEIRETGDLLRRELTAEHECEPISRDLTIQRAVEAALQPRRTRRSWGLLSLAASTLLLGGTTVLLISKSPRGNARKDAATAVMATSKGTMTRTVTEFRNDEEPAPAAVAAALSGESLELAQVDRNRPELFYADKVRGASRSPEPEQAQPPDAQAADESIVAMPGTRMARHEDLARTDVALAESAPALAPSDPGSLPPLAKAEAGFAAAPATALEMAAAPAPAPAPAPGSIEPPPPPMEGVLAAAPAATTSPVTRGMTSDRPVIAQPAPAVLPSAPAAIPPAPPQAPVVAATPRFDFKRSTELRGTTEAARPADHPFGLVPAEADARRQSPGRLIPRADREAFAPLVENPFVRVLEQPQSTFALDVDTASYAIVRRYLMSQNTLPPKDAVRIEEMVNAFRYDDPAPTGDDPVTVHVEIARSPWNAENRLARIALTGKTIAPKDRPRANLVFLIDVSGSMDEPDKLPLLKRGMRMLTEQLGEGDRVAIVTYSDSAKVALPPTRGDQHREILSALESLSPGGSTNGAGGLKLAYEQAGAAFIADGANRVILASDGDFNVGETDNNALVNVIQEKAKSRIFLTVLGFGRGNLQDARLEALADKGNGHYHYIDTPREARRVLVQQVSGTLVTVAKDVKIQVDFNPTKVGAYRLIGFENRLLPAAAFRDDNKDGGELGAGHAVSALYELVPSGKEQALPAADAPQFVKPAAPADPNAPESFVVKWAFKPPDGDVSTFRSIPAIDSGRDYAEASVSFRWASAVASFGQILRASSHRGTATIDGVLELAESARGDDPRGDRKEFLELVRKAKALGAR